jgi:GH24 family phage-related lysozyme (muramidase)
MQTFKFRLEKVQEWYTHQFQTEERKLMVCLAALADAQKAIAALQAQRLAIEQEMVTREAIPAPEFVALGLYRLGAKKREADLIAARRQREAEAQAQRVRTQAAQRKVRLLEKLRQRRVAEHEYALTRELEELAADAFFAKWAAR